MGCCLQPAGKAIIMKESGNKQGDFREIYNTGDKLGEGTFGMVFECTKKNSSDKTVYAVKMLEHQSSWWGQMSRSAQVQWEVFAQEFDMLRRMQHPNVIRLHDVFADSHFLYFVMDKYESSLIASVLPCLQKGKKAMPSCCVGEITHQMLLSIVYLHSMNIVHRDVKADNYLVDGTTFRGKLFKVVLTDLSTARYLEDGVFLKEMLGTMQYWAPEIVARYYTHKVDCWAIGVILWCMLTMKFPFNTVQETYTKKLTFRADRMTTQQFDLVYQLLEKIPTKRLTAAQAEKHAWIQESVTEHKRMVEKYSSRAGSKEAEKERRDSGTFDNNGAAPEDDGSLGFGQIKKEIPDEVADRRREALLDANTRFEKGQRNTMTLDENVRRSQTGDDSDQHVAKDKQRVGEAKSYSWWSEERCLEKRVPDATTKCGSDGKSIESKDDPAREQSGDIALTEPGSVEELEEQLIVFKVDVSKFGTGEAKNLKQLLHELQTHECRMMLRNARVIRVVDLMVLRLKSPNGKYLVEVQQVFPDGRERSVNRLPAVMRKAGGSGIEMARAEVNRLLAQELKTTPDVVQVNMSTDDPMQETVSSVQTSGSYPGLETVYRRSFFSATVNIKARPEQLKSLGLMDETPFSSKQADGGQTGFEWWDEKRCDANKVPVKLQKTELPEMEGFIPVSIPQWNPENMGALLRKHNIDTKLFGVGNARTITDFAQETATGETRLYSKGTELRRYLDILIVKIKNNFGGYLIETGHNFGKGQTRQKNAFPATKVRPFEDKVWAVRRLLREVDIPFASSKIMFGPRRVETSQSPSYPGVVTVYLKQVVEVELNEFDVANLANDGSLGASKWFQMK
mmetsp:Transcript_152253/g.270143  ORF Transcript_152253/g.270143 Transcript_152253/m.270143 type:complete len:850 (-) Transcript_152253:59-2608(-)